MGWSSIAINDLYAGKAAPLIDQLRTAALADGQADPTPGIIQGEINRVRAEVASNANNELDPNAGTVPQSLLMLTRRLILWRMQSRVNVFNAVEPSRQDEQDHRDDETYLRRIASGDATVEDALRPGVMQGKGGVQLVSGGGRQASRAQTSGL